jgi:WD40 repeat protein
MRIPAKFLRLCLLALAALGAGRTNAQTTSGKHPTALTSPSMVNSVAFSPDGRTVLMGSEDNLARMWNAERGKELRRLEARAR